MFTEHFDLDDVEEGEEVLQADDAAEQARLGALEDDPRPAEVVRLDVATPAARRHAQRVGVVAHPDLKRLAERRARLK